MFRSRGLAFGTCRMFKLLLSAICLSVLCQAVSIRTKAGNSGSLAINTKASAIATCLSDTHTFADYLDGVCVCSSTEGYLRTGETSTGCSSLPASASWPSTCTSPYSAPSATCSSGTAIWILTTSSCNDNGNTWYYPYVSNGCTA